MTTLSWRVFFRDANCTLNGYVFSDDHHARTWLAQGFINPTLTMVQKVTVGEVRRCPRCGGSGYHQTIRPIGEKIPLRQFFDVEPATTNEGEAS